MIRILMIFFLCRFLSFVTSTIIYFFILFDLFVKFEIFDIIIFLMRWLLHMTGIFFRFYKLLISAFNMNWFSNWLFFYKRPLRIFTYFNCLSVFFIIFVQRFTNVIIKLVFLILHSRLSFRIF